MRVKGFFGRDRADQEAFAPTVDIPRSNTQAAVEYVEALGGVGGGGTDAPVDAQYLVSSLNTTLTNERVVGNGNGITWDFTGTGSAVANLDMLGLENLTDPGADRILFWDDSEGAFKWLTPTSGLGFEGANFTINDPDLMAIRDAAFASGDVLYHDGVTLTRLPAGTAGQFLRTGGVGAAPSWMNLTGGGDMLGANNLFELTDASIARTNLGLVIGTNVQAYDADLATWAGLTPSANAQSLVTAADYAAMRALLDLEAGTDFLSPAAIAAAYQPLDADLTAWAGVNPSSYSTTAQIAAAYQPLDADLTAWALVNPSSYSTTAQIAAAYQPLDADLTSWAGVTRAAGFDTFAATPSSANLRSLLSDEVGTGAAYFVGGALGTPASATLTNATGLPSIVVAAEAADTTCFPAFFTAATGELGPRTNTGLTYNASTNALTAASFVGALTGNASSVTWANEAADTTCFIGFATAASGSLAPKTNANLTFNASTGVLTSASSVLTTTDINGGTIDGAIIGGASAAAGTFTTATVGNTGLIVGASTPFSDAAGVLTLQNVDALDATTEATIEAAIDTLANLTSIQGVAFTFGAYAPTLLNNANEAAFKAAVNLEIGTDVQAYNARLADLAGITYAQGDIFYFNGTNLVKLAAGTSGDFLKTQGAGANPIWQSIPGGGDALTSGTLAQFAATTSLQLKNVISDETGSGALVFADTPTLIAPILGTPTSGTLTNATGLPIASGVSGLGTGIATALAVNVGTAGAPVVNGGALGTPSSGTLTNATGLPVASGISGLGTGIATALAVNTGSAGAPVLFNGAGGTPSSLTLTNATGLPLSGVTDSTSEALGVGTLEVGHASDTTLSRSAAGILAVEGVVIKNTGRETIWIPASAMYTRTTNGAASGTAEAATNRNMFKTLDFDTATQEFAQFEIHLPKSWNLGTVTFQPVWSHAATTVNFGVVWQLAGIARSDDDAGDVAFGTAQTSTDTGGTTNDIYIGPESAAITIGGTPASGDTVLFQVARAPADGSDTMAIDARLHGLRLFFTTNAATDA